MKTKLILFIITFLFFFNTSPVVYGDDFQDATDAYDRNDYKTAYKLLLTLAKQGDVEAQYRLGLLYDDGYEVPQDYKEAVKWYRRAAENGHTLAGHNLGLMLYEGQGTTQDFKEATKLLKPFGKNYYPSKHAKWYRLEPNYEYAEAQHALEVMKITH
jgi:hypothetical protein